MSPKELCNTVWGGEVLFSILPYATECLVGPGGHTAGALRLLIHRLVEAVGESS